MGIQQSSYVFFNGLLRLIDRENIHQKADQIIDISTWPSHEDYEVFPIGARNKSLRICPDTFEFDFCIPKHKYLFKEAIKSAKDPRKERHPDQYWAEIIAFKIGRLMQLSVPPAFAAINSETGEPGSVIEWFAGYPSYVDERYSHGGDHMQAMVKGYDREKGGQHNLNTILSFSRLLKQHGSLNHDWKEYWGLCLCFDALIGNTDRHQENWGVIWGNDYSKFAPFFDNGTSLGHELFPTKFSKCIKDDNMLAAYVRRGCHHMKWGIEDTKRLPLIDGVILYCKKYPDIIAILIDKLCWKDSDLIEILSELTTFDIKSPLTPERAEFIFKLTLYRKNLLLQNLESIRK